MSEIRFIELNKKNKILQVLGLVNENRIKKEDDSISVRPSVMQQSHLLPVQQHQLQQTATLPPQQRDLMRQALQAVVAPKSSDQELIEYSYTAGDIQGRVCL